MYEFILFRPGDHTKYTIVYGMIYPNSVFVIAPKENHGGEYNIGKSYRINKYLGRDEATGLDMYEAVE